MERVLANLTVAGFWLVVALAAEDGSKTYIISIVIMIVILLSNLFTAAVNSFRNFLHG